MYKIGICDDEKIYRDEIKDILVRYCGEREIKDYRILECTSGEELFNNERPDILLLDVQMSGMDGLEVKEWLEGRHSNTKIIFITSYPGCMQDAFGVNVLGFLNKPIDYNQLCAKLDKAIAMCQKESEHILYDECGKVIKIKIKDILYIESNKGYTDIHIEGEGIALISEKSLRDYKLELGKDFEMCHRSYLVNLKHVKEIDEEVVLENGLRLPISRRCRLEFVESYKKSIWERTEDNNV